MIPVTSEIIQHFYIIHYNQKYWTAKFFSIYVIVFITLNYLPTNQTNFLFYL